MKRDYEDSEPSHLRWCVGKFVYARGASKPLHFMELKKFIIDNATDYSHLFYLRALRKRQSNQGAVDDELKRWMEGTAVKPIAEALHHVLNEIAGETAIVEYFPGVGLTFEYLKMLLERCAASDPASKRISFFEGRGPASLHNQFMVLQQDDDYTVRYVDEKDAASDMGDGNTIGLFNYNQTVRYDTAPKAGLDQFLKEWCGPAVISMRVTKGDAKEAHTNVMGRIIELPSLQEVIAQCRRVGEHWHYCFEEGFDSGFFLPDDKGPTGLFIAYTAGRPTSLKGFEPII